jgi:hypothetical protein
MVIHLKCVRPVTALLSGEKSGSGSGMKSVGAAMHVDLVGHRFVSKILRHNLEAEELAGHPQKSLP